MERSGGANWNKESARLRAEWEVATWTLCKCVSWPTIQNMSLKRTIEHICTLVIFSFAKFKSSTRKFLPGRICVNALHVTDKNFRCLIPLTRNYFWGPNESKWRLHYMCMSIWHLWSMSEISFYEFTAGPVEFHARNRVRKLTIPGQIQIFNNDYSHKTACFEFSSTLSDSGLIFSSFKKSIDYHFLNTSIQTGSYYDLPI